MKNENYKRDIVVFIFVLSFLLYLFLKPYFINATATIGTIDSVYKYAKGVDDTLIKINFGLFKGNIDVKVNDVQLLPPPPPPYNEPAPPP